MKSGVVGWWPALARIGREMGRGVALLAYPMECLACGRGPEYRCFCDGCAGGILAASRQSCPRCARPVGPHADLDGGCAACRGQSLGFSRVVALGAYEGAVREACLRMKGGGGRWLAPWLADLLYEAQAEHLAAFAPDWVVPVPLHWWRRRGRGYNQAELLARRLAHRLGREYSPCLRRVRPTPPLAGLSGHARQAALSAAFAPRRGVSPSGASILLVDDILTTGATCREAARTLRAAGAGRIMVAVVGRTVEDD